MKAVYHGRQHQVFACRQDRAGERFADAVGIVAQQPSGKVHIIAGGVVKFDPFGLGIYTSTDGVVLHFVDQDLGVYRGRRQDQNQS
jgi:hypothetical protein